MEQKGCYTPIWGNTIGVDRILVLPMGWNWHGMYLWLLSNKFRPYLSWSFTSMPSGIVEVQNCSLGDYSQKICLRTMAGSNQPLHIFSQFSLIVLIMPRQTPIDIGHEVLALACEGMRQSAIVCCPFSRATSPWSSLQDCQTANP